MEQILAKLENWYSAQCNGEWEHTYGIKVDTLDNPGWSVTIDLDKTQWAAKEFPKIFIENSPNDWLRCWKDNRQFRGTGDPSKLRSLLSHFLDHVV